VPQEAPPRRLLFVDDEERILSALCRTLRREGYEIVTANSVESALEILDQGPVDLILSDFRMPRMTGLELFAEARRRQPQIACILITGWSQAVSAEELAAAEVATLISKPWEDAVLKDALREALSEV
jgi:DNA-binding NtrC family response regulator